MKSRPRTWPCFPPGVCPGGLLVLVKTDLSIIRREKRRKAVKKTLTIPQWMDEEAKAQDINFSAVLQEGLAERLGGTGRRN